jgi:hypothetical protein
MIDLVLVKFLRDHTPYMAGMTASFAPAVAETLKKGRIVEIVGPLKATDQLPLSGRVQLKDK